MKITGNEPINARPYSHDERPSVGYEGDRPETFQAFTGLTIRQYYAGLAMQSFINISIDENAANGIDKLKKLNKKEPGGILSCMAVEMADALINELNKESE